MGSPPQGTAHREPHRGGSQPERAGGLLKESAAATKMMLTAASASQSPLLKALSDDLRSNVSLPDLPRTADPALLRSAGIETIKASTALVSGKASAEEAREFSQWLAKIAQATAEATKEGGFLGFGGTQVSREEQAALEDLHAALGLPKAA
jgi:hypothetical protein